MDETLDNTATDVTTIEAESPVASMSAVQPELTEHDHQDVDHSDLDPQEDVQVYPAMSELDITRYAQQIKLPYPTTDGTVLYQIAECIPLHLRASFEAGLGDAQAIYRTEVEQRGDPEFRAVRDILPLYLKMGFVSTTELFEGYQHACTMGQKMEFLQVLRTRNEKAIEYLKAMVAGTRLREHVVIQNLPLEANRIE
jgi:hypothetical protein